MPKWMVLMLLTYLIIGSLTTNVTRYPHSQFSRPVFLTGRKEKKLNSNNRMKYLVLVTMQKFHAINIPPAQNLSSIKLMEKDFNFNFHFHLGVKKKSIFIVLYVYIIYIFIYLYLYIYLESRNIFSQVSPVLIYFQSHCSGSLGQ